jgi:hypothetical protein
VLFPSSLPYFCKNISINILISSTFYQLYCKMRQNLGYQGADFLLQSSYYFKYSLFVLLELFLCYSPLLCLIFAKYIYKYWDYISILSVILQNAAKFGVSRRQLFTPILVLFQILFICVIGVILALFPSYLPYLCKNISINILISSTFYLLFCKMRQNLGYQGADFLRQSSYYFKYSLFVLLELFLCYSHLLCLIFAKIYL